MRAKLVPAEVVREYSNAVSRHGPESPEAEEVYRRHAAVEGFPAFAAALADLKRALGGCGIDYKHDRSSGDSHGGGSGAAGTGRART